jgi:hypothetical protein
VFEHNAFGQGGRKSTTDGRLSGAARAGQDEERQPSEPSPVSARGADVFVALDVDLVGPGSASFADVQHGLNVTAALFGVSQCAMQIRLEEIGFA